MSEIITEIKERKKFTSVVNQEMEEYKIYTTSDGEHFSTLPSAKRYQKKYDRMEEFKKYFNFSHGNLRKGNFDLVRKAFSITPSHEKYIEDYFWIKCATVEEIDVVIKFINKHYGILQHEIQKDINLIINKWFFIAIHNKFNKAYICDVDQINEEINVLKSLIPNFDSKDVEILDDDQDNRFGILDL